MKNLVITGITEENYISVIKRIETLFPLVRWYDDNKKPHTSTYTELKESYVKEVADKFLALSINLSDYSLFYWTYKKANYVPKKYEIALPATQFLKQNVLNMPIEKFI